VRAFQSARGLPADGTVGSATWQALATTVQQGASGPAVQAVQAELVAHGALLDGDGAFGPATAAAVRAFQTSHGLTADGIVSATTWRVLVS